MVAYAAAKTPQERAELEERMWRLLPPAQRHGVDRRSYLADLLGHERAGSKHGLVARRALLHAPQILWDRVNAGMPYDAATRIQREAQMHHEGGTFEDAIVARIAAYEAIPLMANGRRRGTGMGVVPIRARPQPQPVQPVDSDYSSRVGWNALRAMLVKIIDAKFHHRKVEPTDAQRADVLRYAESELEAVIAGINGRVIGATRRAEEAQVITRRQVLDACQVLMFDPPRPGALVDLVVARTKKRTLASAYHADKVGDGMRDQYEAVIEAFTVLSRYNDALEKKAGN
jgi:hypothetical protein